MRGDACDTGFTLMELLLTITIIGIVAAIATPGLTRARGASFEASTIGTLRTISSSQTAFATVCGGGFYAPSLNWLARPPVGGGEPFIAPEFSRNVVDRQGYRIRFRRGDRASAAPRTCNGLGRRRTVQTFFVGADPRQRRRGMSPFRHQLEWCSVPEHSSDPSVPDRYAIRPGHSHSVAPPSVCPLRSSRKRRCSASCRSDPSISIICRYMTL